MGQLISVADIVRLGEEVISEFQSRSNWGRFTAATSAPSTCAVPQEHDWPKLRHYTECQFLRSQRDAWELVMVLAIILLIAILILLLQSKNIVCGIVSKTTKQVVSVVNKLNVANGSDIEQGGQAHSLASSAGNGDSRKSRTSKDSWI